MSQSLVEQIQNLLPQTQCEKCGFKGCKPYAEALVKGQADINLCHPGGDTTMSALASLLQLPEKPVPVTAHLSQIDQTAVIREESCIGCTKCIQACPVDAILGGSKKLHAVITDYCTGCGLCLPVCPVDCIDLINTTEDMPTWVINAPAARVEKAKASWARFDRRQIRLTTEQQAKKQQHDEQVREIDYKSDIQAAIERAKAKRNKLADELEYPMKGIL